MKANPFTQDELDTMRFVMTAGTLQIATAKALAQCVGHVETAAILDSYKVQGEELCKRILNGEVRGNDVGQA